MSSILHLRKCLPRFKSSLHKIFSALLFLALMTAFILYPNQVRSSISYSLNYCLKVLIPSLFPFMALTAYLINSGAGDVFGKLFGWITKYVFKLPKACTASIFMSLIGGYPSGAIGISTLLKRKQINTEQAGRMLLFCINPGIAFVVTFVGSFILGDIFTGLLIFISISFGSILIGITSGIFQKVPSNTSVHSEKQKAPQAALILAAQSASVNLLKMCACILLFSSITAILNGSGLMRVLAKFLSSKTFFTFSETSALLSLLTEISQGINDAAALRVALPLFVMGLAFGGLCVHLQSFSFFEKFPVSIIKFYLYRILHAVLSTGIFVFIRSYFPTTTNVFFSTAIPIMRRELFGTTAAGGLSLLCMCIAFLLISFADREKNNPLQ